MPQAASFLQSKCYELSSNSFQHNLPSCPVNCQPQFEVTGVGRCISDQSLDVCFRSSLPMAESPLRNPGVVDGHALSKQQNVPTDKINEQFRPYMPLYLGTLLQWLYAPSTPRCLRLGTPGLVASVVDKVTRVSRCLLSFYFLPPTVEKLASGLMCRCIWRSLKCILCELTFYSEACALLLVAAMAPAPRNPACA